MNKIVSILALLLLSACDSDKGSTDVSNICDNGVEMPSALVGNWEREFDRNGSSGISVLTITSNCTFQSYEIGDANIMEEWHSGLTDGVVYKFISDPSQEISSATNREIYVVNSTGTATITNNETQDIVEQWDISQAGSYYQYQVTGDTLEIGVESYGISYSYIKI